jgi:membrane-bound lytic murein transglycosylase D
MVRLLPASLRLLALVIFLFLLPGARAQQQQQQDEPLTVNDLLSAAEDWARDNLDDDVLKLLEDVDRDRLRSFLVELESRFQTNSVYELAPLRAPAKDFVQFLEQWEETLPLAQWLKTRLDYLDVAEELKRAAPLPTKPNTPRPPPTFTDERTIWERQFDRRPFPIKAEALVPKLKRIFRSEKLPAELVWVAEVESSFNPAARSPVGAAGLFQLMKPTAQSYGLSTALPDERNDPEKNARAAAKYLRHLHERFGDWPLALAAYNTGETRLDNLLKNSRSRDFRSIAPKLPAETQLYVPKCDAALQKREGISLEELRPPSS